MRTCSRRMRAAWTRKPRRRLDAASAAHSAHSAPSEHRQRAPACRAEWPTSANLAAHEARLGKKGKSVSMPAMRLIGATTPTEFDKKRRSTNIGNFALQQPENYHNVIPHRDPARNASAPPRQTHALARVDEVEALLPCPSTICSFVPSRSIVRISIRMQCSAQPCFRSRPAAAPKIAATAPSLRGTTPDSNASACSRSTKFWPMRVPPRKRGFPFCMGAAWRGPGQRPRTGAGDGARSQEARPRDLCDPRHASRWPGRAPQKRTLGLTTTITTSIRRRSTTARSSPPTLQDRLDTLDKVRNAGVNVCCGGIVGMGEDRRAAPPWSRNWPT